MKKIAIIAVFILLGICKLYAAMPEGKPYPANAQIAFRFGIEWGYPMTILKYHNFNYLESEIGYRVVDVGTDCFFHSNLFFKTVFGMDILDKLNLSACLGISGVNDFIVFPVTLRFTYLRNGHYRDGWQFFLESGCGIKDMRLNNPASYMAIPGAGYRLALGGKAALDFKASLRVVVDFPYIRSADTGEIISGKNVSKSITIYYGPVISAAFSF